MKLIKLRSFNKPKVCRDYLNDQQTKVHPELALEWAKGLAIYQYPFKYVLTNYMAMFSHLAVLTTITSRAIPLRYYSSEMTIVIIPLLPPQQPRRPYPHKFQCLQVVLHHQSIYFSSM